MIFNYLILKNRFVTYADIVCRIKVSEDIGLQNCNRIQEGATDCCVEKEGAGLICKI
jgi:hypothetical protein